LVEARISLNGIKNKEYRIKHFLFYSSEANQEVKKEFYSPFSKGGEFREAELGVFSVGMLL
jgi:hypothetical protein